MVIWTDNAISHITKFIDESIADNEEEKKTYMRKLVDYTEILEKMPRIGKDMKKKILNYEIRQLIYRKHRIIYNIDGVNVVILAALHTRLDINKALKNLRRDLK